MRRAVLLIALATTPLASAARAEPAPLNLSAPAKAADVTALNAAVLAPDRQSHVLPQAGIARTSIDHRFDRAGASGALGFLCGRPDSLDERARSQAFGSDPHGRFLGARLSLAF
jgi:hypothetical protein